MNPLPLVTVLMPCYNALPYLNEALESILNQTYRNLEILCINDGSSDDTGSVLEEYANKDIRIRVIHNENNIRLIRSLNKGIELANGEYIARMDSDDISTPDRIEKELNYILSNPNTDIVGCSYYIINEFDKVFSKSYIRQHRSMANFFASFFYVPLGHSELLFKTKVLKENHYLYEDYALHTEDYELWSRLLRKGYNLQNIDTPLHYVRINPSSVSHKYTRLQDDNFVECARRHIENYFLKKIDPKVMQILVNRIPDKINRETVKKGIGEVKWIKNHFLKHESSRIGPADKKEIYIVYNTHVFDICIQIIKRAKWESKLYAFGFLFTHINMFFNRNVWRYIIGKFCINKTNLKKS